MHLRSLEYKNALAPSFFVGKVGLSMSLGELWAKWRFLGHHVDSPANYRCMLELLKQRWLTPVGDAAEFTLLDGGLTDNPEEYTTEIQIPVAYFSQDG